METAYTTTCHRPHGRVNAGPGSEHSTAGPLPSDAVVKCTFIRHMVARARGIDIAALDAATRKAAPVALARQVSMYLAHISCGLSLSEVGRGFARDRTTVAHACRLVEDFRDAPDVDLSLDCLEAAIAAWFDGQGSRHAE